MYIQYNKYFGITLFRQYTLDKVGLDKVGTL